MKKLLATLLALALIITGTFFFIPKASEAEAATNDVGNYVAVTKAECDSYQKDEAGVPQKDGYLFAGYFKSEVFTKQNAGTKDNYAYAKFVKDDMLNIKVQVTNGVVRESSVEDDAGNKQYIGKYVIRFVSSVESTEYKNVGFELEYQDANGQTKKMRNTTSTVFKGIESTTGYANGQKEDYNFSPKVVGSESEYFTTAKLPVSVGKEDVVYTVRAFWTTPDGTVVMGGERSVSVNDAKNNTVNLQVKTSTDLTGATLKYASTADVTSGQTGTFDVLSYNAETGIANVRVTLAGGAAVSSLKSATKFVFTKDGSDVATAIFRNYYVAGKTEDTSWYDVDPTATSFVLGSTADFVGFRVVSQTDSFTNDTVILARNIVFDKGYAIGSAETGSVPQWTGESSWWSSIGSSSKPFSGIFDGDGNEISGIFTGDTDSYSRGLFGYATNAELKNFKLVNSFFGFKGKNNGIVGTANNVKFKNIYTDVVVKMDRAVEDPKTCSIDSAVFVGNSTGSSLEFDNCWFDGELYITNGEIASVFIGLVSYTAPTFKFTDCLSTGKVYNIGGKSFGTLVGWNSWGGNGVQTYTENCLIANVDNQSTKTDSRVLIGKVNGKAALNVNNLYVADDITGELYGGVSAVNGEAVERVNVVEMSALTQEQVEEKFPASAGKEESAWVKDEATCGTPILKSFATYWSEKQEVTPNTEWYVEGQNEYVLNTAEDLYGFAELAKTNNFVGKTVKLGANIELNKVDADILNMWIKGQAVPATMWTPIGNATTPFAGTFDGQGYEISGLYLNTSTQTQGMFGTVAYDAEIKNFKLVDSYMKTSVDYLGLVGKGLFKKLENVYTNAYMETSADNVGGFVADLLGHNLAQDGYDKRPMIIDNCWFDGTIVGGEQSQTLAGFIANRRDVSVKYDMSNCLYTGTIKSNYKGNAATVRVGAFVGWVSRYGLYSVNNCLAAGTIEAIDKTTVGAFGYHNTSYITSGSYSYACDMSFFASDGGNAWKGETKTREELLASDVTTLFPNSTAWVNDVAYNSTDRGTPVLAIFADWWFARQSEDGLQIKVDTSWYNEADTEFVLTKPEHLYGLGVLSSKYDFAGQTIKLGANIVLNEVDDTILAQWQADTAKGRNWTPIGNSTNKFAGTFDGQGYEISGLYHKSTSKKVGLFGSTAFGSVIKNFRLVDSYISGNGVVGLIGESSSSKLENIYSNATVVSTGDHVGGFIGETIGYYTDKKLGISEGWAQGKMEINGCWFDGEVSLTGNYYSAAGFLGYPVQRSLVEFNDCLYTGKVTGTYSSVRLGGFCGWINSTAQYEFNNCLALGELGDGGYVGGIAGQTGVDKDTVVLTNCYTTHEMLVSYMTNEQTFVDSSVKTVSELQQAVIADLFPGTTAWTADTVLDVTGRGTPILDYFAEWWLAEQGNPSDAQISAAWYTGTPNSSTYTIRTKGELLALPILVNGGIDFAGKTIVLKNDIKLNKADVAAWKKGTIAECVWTPVGTSENPFKGTFDGQGNTISGAYVKAGGTQVGFFGLAGAGSKIKNLRLVDSYIEQTAGAWSRFTGAVVGDACGDIDNVYCNATVVSKCNYVGGIAGRVQAGLNTNAELAITNCWFDGNIQLADGIGYTGGIVGQQLNGKLYLQNVLYTGHIRGKHTGNAFIAGILGITAGGVKGTELDSVVSSGTFDIQTGTKFIGSVVGYFSSGADSANKANYTLKNVFANREWGTASTWGGSNGTHTGQVIQTADNDRLIGYVPQVARDIKNNVLLDAQKLDFTSAWTMRINDVPVPTALKDVVPAKEIVTSATMTAFTTELGLGTISGNLSNAVAEAAGDYVVTVNGTKALYDSYLVQLASLGFKKYVDNANTPMAEDGIYSATFCKSAAANLGEWVVNVTFVTNDGKIYVSINSDVDSVAKTLLNDDTKNPIGVEDGTNAVSLSMVEDIDGIKVTGNCFVFQLPNGHFIINDGNSDTGAGKILKAYLQAQVGEGNPIYIDAWTITHFHNDHAGALMDFANDASLRENVYLNAVYANEPSAYGATIYETRTVGDINSAIQGAKLLTKSPTDNSAPDFYEVHMGQRYYFNGITMDIVNAPEQIAVDSWSGGDSSKKTHVPDPFNTSSVNFVFSLSETGKRILLGGDSTKITMQYIMDAYGENNSTLANINVFAAYHHGKNVMNDYDFSRKPAMIGYVGAGEGTNEWADFLLKNSNNGSNYKFDVMLFPNDEVMDAVKKASFLEYKNVWVADDESVVYPSNISELNKYYYDNAKLYFTTGFEDITSATEENAHGTVKITFNADGQISHTVYNSVHGQETYTFEAFVPTGGDGTVVPDEDL